MSFNKSEPEPMHILKFQKVKSESAKAWYIQFVKRAEWLPKSQCKIDIKNTEIEVPEWLVESKDLWEFSC